MPICPNKVMPEWKALVQGLKERNPKATDADVDAMAHLAFVRKGDGSIPDIESASVLLFKGKTKQLKQEVKEAFKSFKLGKRVGVKEVTETVKEQANKIKEYLGGLVIKGRITNSQAKSIAKRAASVGKSERAFDKFTKYVDNIIDNANYQAEMDSVKSMQKSAQKIKTSLANEIKSFTSIDPENIPAEMMTRYKQALDMLMGKVPNPSMMNEMLPEISKIKYEIAQEGEFKDVDNAAKADEILTRIKTRELVDVESYREQISDINKLKRKLNQLVEEGNISEQEYDKLSEDIGFTQQKFEQNNKEAIDAIKQEYVNDIQRKISEKPTVQMSEQERLLFDRIQYISEKQLKAMSPEELYIFNEALDVAKEGYVDVAKLSEAINAAESVDAIDVAEQLNTSRPNTKTEDEQYRKLRAQDDVYWEMVLGLPVNKVGAVFKQIIAPYRRGLANYVLKNIEFRRVKAEIDRNIKLDSIQDNKIGMYVHFLQEYARRFDDRFKGFKDVGNRDEFNTKLYDPARNGMIPDKNVLSDMQKAYESFPKDAEGKVDIDDLYNDFVNNGGKYLTEEERNYLNLHWDLIREFGTPNQRFAAGLRNTPFVEIPYYMPRQEYKGRKIPTAESQISISGNKRNIRVKSPFAEERKAYDIEKSDIPKTAFSYLMYDAVEKSIRDAEITKMLHNMNARLNKVYENVSPEKKRSLDALVRRMEEGLRKEVGDNSYTAASQIFDRINSARAVEALLSPDRALLVEFPSGIVSYPIRSGVYTKAFDAAGKSKFVESIKEFTESPLRIKDYIVAEYSADAQRVVYKSGIKKLTQDLAGFTERKLNNTVWLPKFKEAFKDLTGQDFVESKFSDAEYRKKYYKEIMESGAVADSETQEIIGPIISGSGRVTIDNIFIKPFTSGKPLEVSDPVGKIISFFGGYPYRDYMSFIKGIREASDAYNYGEGIGKSLVKFSKPLGVLAGVATYGYLSNLLFGARGYGIAAAAGNEKDKAYYKEQLDNSLSYEKMLAEIPSAAAQIVTGRYGSEGKIAFDALGAIAYYSADASGNEELKQKIADVVKNTTYWKIPTLDNINSYYGRNQAKEKVLDLIQRNVAVLSTVTERIVDVLGGIEAAGEVIKDYQQGKDVGTKEDAAKALLGIISMTNLFLLPMGLSIPEGKKVKQFVQSYIQEPVSGGRTRGRSTRGSRR